MIVSMENDYKKDPDSKYIEIDISLITYIQENGGIILIPK